MIKNTTLINPEIVLEANAETFDNIALQVFGYQYEHNVIYRQYCDAIHRDRATVTHITNIPFLPISFFKTHRVLSGQYRPGIQENELIFESSGTTGDIPSRHYVTDPALYEQSLLQGFRQFYGMPRDYTILALLPSYLERKNASLVYMARTLMAESSHADNGFYINEWERLRETLMRLEQNKQKTLLLGVTFALLDFAAAYPMRLAHTVVMETGGMKGRKQELTRVEVHAILKEAWGLQHIHSEYGMTELLSQAYATTDGIFGCTNTMKVLVRDMDDPFDIKRTGTGCLNIIDLANIHSCSFIATEDIGKIAAKGTFEVLGRMDNSALRGCSLMAV